MQYVIQTIIIIYPCAYRVMLFIFALPVMQVILFCLAIGRDPTGLHLAIVNKEMNWDTMDCPVYDNCTLSMFSCRYLNALPKDTVILVSIDKSNKYNINLNQILILGLLRHARESYRRCKSW